MVMLFVMHSLKLTGELKDNLIQKKNVGSVFVL